MQKHSLASFSILVYNKKQSIQMLKILIAKLSKANGERYVVS